MVAKFLQIFSILIKKFSNSRNMRPIPWPICVAFVTQLTLPKILFIWIFVWSIVWYSRKFLQHWGLKWIYFPVSVQHGNLWSLLALLLGEIDMCTNRVFYRKFNSQRLLLEAFFDITDIFGSAGPLSESTFLFQYITIFETWQSWEPLAPLQGEIDIHYFRYFSTAFKNFSLILF